MKLKEYPLAFYHSFKLKSLSLEKLNCNSKRIPIVISLTTIESRLNKVHITLRSIMNQSVKPEKIVIWVTENDRHKIPESLLILTGELLEIKFTSHTSSHKKLTPSLEIFPDKVIVTCDDDLIYEKTWLENLYNSHLKYPKDIICNRARVITADENKITLDYKFWKYTTEKTSLNHLAIGEGGILYPPNALNSKISDYELALKLCPKSDDLWFKAMALLNNTNVRLAERLSKQFIPIPGTQKISLKKINVDKNFNVNQCLKEYFNLTIS